MIRLAALLPFLILASPANQANRLDAASAVLQSDTNLLETTVVARDKTGRFIDDLRKDELKIYVDGKQANIASFASASPINSRVDVAYVHRPGPSSGIEFTNIADLHRKPGSVSVLIDPSNTNYDDESTAEAEARHFIDKLPNGLVRAVYVLGNTLDVIWDADKPESPPDLKALSRAFKCCSNLIHVNGRRRIQLNLSEHQSHTLAAMESIGRRLADAPARQALIWYSSSSIPPLNELNAHLKEDDLRMFGVLSHYQIVLYPVPALAAPRLYDEHNTASSSSPRPAIGNSTLDLNVFTNGIQRRLAASTGADYGDAWDILSAVNIASSENQHSYRLVFHQESRKDGATPIALTVECNRPGVIVRTPRFYFPEPRQSLDTTDRGAAMDRLISSRVPAAEIPLKVNPKLLDDQSGGRTLSLTVQVSPPILLANTARDDPGATLDLLYAFFASGGYNLGGKKGEIHLRPSTHDAHGQRFWKFTQTVAVPPKGDEFRLAVRNPVTGLAGSIAFKLCALSGGCPK